jgi:hypothetical protein
MKNAYEALSFVAMFVLCGFTTGDDKDRMDKKALQDLRSVMETRNLFKTERLFLLQNKNAQDNARGLYSYACNCPGKKDPRVITLEVASEDYVISQVVRDEKGMITNQSYKVTRKNVEFGKKEYFELTLLGTNAENMTQQKDFTPVKDIKAVNAAFKIVCN